MKIKNYLSRHLSRHSNAETSIEDPAQRPITYWPRPGTQSFLPDEPSEMTAYLTKQHHVEKAARKDEKLVVSANNSGSYLPLRDTDHGTAASDAPFPRLRRKPNFSDAVKGKLNIKSSDQSQKKSAGENTMEKLHNLRRNMKEGRLEQVIPPRQPSRTEGQLAPSPNRFVDSSPRVSGESSRGRSSSRHRSSSRPRHSSQSYKTKSSSRRIAQYIRTSADLLDEKRREVQSKFQAPFEHLNYPSFSLSRRASVASSKSAESFFCVGEGLEEQTTNTQAIHALKARQQESAERDSRLSGVGATPWANRAAENCKLCGQFTVTGLQGLCEACESDFCQPKARNQYRDSEWWEDDIRDDDIKPTPPLKDRNTLSMRRERDTQHYFQNATNRLELDDEKPPVPLKDMGLRPIFNPVPSRQFSQKAEIVDGDDERYLNWQTASQQDEFEKTQGMFERWSTSFENEDRGMHKEGDKAPLIERTGKGKKKEASRDTNFYYFYDDVLGDQ
jgi:hypothetical protein